jgi:hypothetical protein
VSSFSLLNPLLVSSIFLSGEVNYFFGVQFIYGTVNANT